MERSISFGEDIKIDNGIFFGAGVFETILILNKPVAIKFHLDRLNKAIEDLNLGEKLSLEQFEKLSSGYNNCILKILVTEKNIIVKERKNPYSDEDYKKGFSIKVSKVIKSSTSRLVYYKTINYIENIIEKNLAIDEGYNEPIFINEKGFITEGATSNIFIVKDKKIYTPKISCGLLNGTTRQWVINNFNVYEKEITIEELECSDEVFLTNSIIGIMKVSNFEECKYSDTMIINEITEKYETYLMNYGGNSNG